MVKGRLDAERHFVPSTGNGAARSRSRPEPSRNVVCRNEGSQARLLRFSGLSRTPRAAHLHQLARVATPDVRLGAVRIHHGPSDGLLGLWPRRHMGRAARYALCRDRTAFPRVRDLSSQRAHVLADEPRAGSRGDERRFVRRGPALAPLFSRQSPSSAAASRIAALQLPDCPAVHDPALVSGGQRSFHGNLDGRRDRPRAGRL